MNEIKRYLVSATCFVLVSGILLTSPVFASPNTVSTSFQDPEINTTRRNLSPGHKGDLPLVEEFSFLIKDFKLTHQSENHNLNITVRYRYLSNIANAEYPDFRLIAKDIEELLTHYPNRKDYWEIVNKKITLMVLEKYPAIVKVRSEMQVSPSSLAPYFRSSIVTRSRASVRTNGTKGMRRG